MTANLQIFKCNICGNIVEVWHAGVGELVCCGQPMELLGGKLEEEGYEKHVPVIERTEDGVKVKVGSVPHPMEEEHYIEWIELIVANGQVYNQFLQPGVPPEATFATKATNITARAYCNVHGMWKVEGAEDVIERCAPPYD